MKRLRFDDLVANGIVRNRATLSNRIKNNGFPPGKLTGPNERTWSEKEVEDYVENCPTEPKPTPRSPGRPRVNSTGAA